MADFTERARQIGRKPFPQRWDTEGFENWIQFISNELRTVAKEALVESLATGSDVEDLQILTKIVILFNGLNEIEKKLAIVYLADRFGGKFRCVWIPK